MATAVPRWLLSSATENPSATPALETTHVHRVYDALATQWAGTRYKAWPAVVAFLDAHAQSAHLIAEFGCGNGKNLPVAAAKTSHVIASDVCEPLCEIAALQTKRADVHVADIVHLPLRSHVCDLVVCVAVLHHLSTLDRRKRAVGECARVLVPGGRAVFLAWAHDQTSGYSGHSFPAQDVFVPFHQRVSAREFAAAFQPSDASKELGHGVYVEDKRAVVLQRYCHVFARGELESLVEQCGFNVVRSFDDTGNWVVEAIKPLFAASKA